MIRNYRQIGKTGSNISGWGSGRSQVISPIRDSIKIILPLKLKLTDKNGLDFTDSVAINFVRPSLNFILNDNHGNFATDSVNVSSSEVVLNLNDINNFNMEDEANYEK